MRMGRRRGGESSKKGKKGKGEKGGGD